MNIALVQREYHKPPRREQAKTVENELISHFDCFLTNWFRKLRIFPEITKDLGKSLTQDMHGLVKSSLYINPSYWTCYQ